jgi:hypothetical protein
VTRCKASFLCLASGLAGWLATAGQGSRRGISHGYAATLIFRGSAYFRASCGWGAAGAAGQEGEGGGGDGLMWRLGLGRCGLGGENT